MSAPDGAESPFVRSFIAVGISEEVRGEITLVQNRLKKTGAHVSWVRPENIHLSLQFLGDLARDRIEAVSRVVNTAAGSVQVFHLVVRGIGSFGRGGSPRVIWAGTEHCPELGILHSHVQKGLADVGIKTEERTFRPHLTVGRVRSSRGRQDLIAALKPFESTLFGECEIDRIKLVQSKLRPSGPEYTSLHSAPLGG